MRSTYRPLLSFFTLILTISLSHAQNSFKLKYNNSAIYAGIEVGSKGVKISVIEIGKNAQSRGAFNVLKDSSVNTDFITFSPSTFHNTLEGLCGLYFTLTKQYKISPRLIYTMVSSGVKI